MRRIKKKKGKVKVSEETVLRSEVLEKDSFQLEKGGLNRPSQSSQSIPAAGF